MAGAGKLSKVLLIGRLTTGHIEKPRLDAGELMQCAHHNIKVESD